MKEEEEEDGKTEVGKFFSAVGCLGSQRVCPVVCACLIESNRTELRRCAGARDSPPVFYLSRDLLALWVLVLLIIFLRSLAVSRAFSVTLFLLWSCFLFFLLTPHLGSGFVIAVVVTPTICSL